MTFVTPGIPTDQWTVLEAFRDRLIEQLALSESTCIVSEEHDPPAKGAQHNLMLLISPGGGRYGEEQDGGGGNTLIERSDVTITVYSRMRLDRTGHLASATTNADRGLLVWKKKILRAILKDGDTAGWMPTNADGDYILTDFPQAVDSSKAYKVQDGCWALDVVVSADFLWDLSDE